MPILFFDNYRGFSNAFIDLKKMNFLVGENSTGKTSVLKLIKAISNPNFWMSANFNTEDTELGYFNEIVTVNSKRNYFEIGILDNNHEGTVNAVLMRYEDRNGQPKITQVRYRHNQVEIEAYFNESKVKYRVGAKNQLEFKPDIDQFMNWVQNNPLKKRHYKLTDMGNRFGGFWILQLQILISSESKKASSITEVLSDLELPQFINDIFWMAPIRTEPKRTYDSYKTTFNPTGTHAPYILKNLLDEKSNSKTRKRALKILRKFGNDSGLFDEIAVNSLGSKSTAPFEIRLSLNGKSLKITNVGYGVSQILPLVIEIISSVDESWFAIQQPEIHLHPRAQAAFGDFLHKSIEENKMGFIVETHSDFTIDRFRIRLANSSKKAEKDWESQIVFFSRSEKGNIVSCIEINDDGSYSEDQPPEFRDFFIREELNLISL